MQKGRNQLRTGQKVTWHIVVLALLSDLCHTGRHVTPSMRRCCTFWQETWHCYVYLRSVSPPTLTSISQSLVYLQQNKNGWRLNTKPTLTFTEVIRSHRGHHSAIEFCPCWAVIYILQDIFNLDGVCIRCERWYSQGNNIFHLHRLCLAPLGFATGALWPL